MTDLVRKSDVPAIEGEAQRLEAKALADRTWKAYADAWDHFLDWCDVNRFRALPAEVATVRAYVADLSRRYAPSTIEQRLAAIKKCHEKNAQPIDLHALADLRRGNRRDKGATRRRKAALVDADLVAILKRMGGTLPELRDRLILLLGFAGGLRRSEIAGLDVTHVEFSKAGALLYLPHSKGGDPDSDVEVPLARAGRAILCPVRALKDWLEASGFTEGPLLRSIDRFGNMSDGRLTDVSIRRIVIARAKAAGFTKRISTHSLRAGTATAAIAAGAPLTHVQRFLRHKSVQTTAVYDRGEGDNPMRRVLDADAPDDPPPPIPVKRGPKKVPAAEILTLNEFAPAVSAPLRLDRLQLEPVDLAPLNEALRSLDQATARARTVIAALPPEEEP